MLEKRLREAKRDILSELEKTKRELEVVQRELTNRIDYLKNKLKTLREDKAHINKILKEDENG